jgi:hypothetical protein
VGDRHSSATRHIEDGPGRRDAVTGPPAGIAVSKVSSKIAFVASPPKNDAWPPYRPDQQRLVFVRQPGRMLPFLGLVITWPVAGTGGRFLVAFWDDSSVQPGIRIAWMKRHELVPIIVDPNWLDGPAPWREHRTRC